MPREQHARWNRIFRGIQHAQGRASCPGKQHSQEAACPGKQHAQGEHHKRNMLYIAYASMLVPREWSSPGPAP
jgi:hypothetical protein